MATKRASEMTAEELKTQRAKWAEAKRQQVAKKRAAALAAEQARASMKPQFDEMQAKHDESAKRAGETLVAGIAAATEQPAPRTDAQLPTTTTETAPASEPAAQPAGFAKKVSKRSGAAAGGMADRARELILAGKTNAEVREVLTKDFGLPEKHAYYPSWYRAQLVMQGQITKEWAREHSGCARKAK